MNNQAMFCLNDKVIDNFNSPFLIAELSGNHKGDIQRAKRIMDEAHAAGFDALKLQFFTPEDMTLPLYEREFVVNGGMWQGRSLYDLYKESALPEEWLASLFKHANNIGLYLFSSVFSPKGLAVLESLNCPAYKIASFEAMDIPLIKAVAKTQKPLIVSTGIIDDQGMEDVIEACRSVGNEQLAFMHCISDYPAPYESFNLRTLRAMVERFKLPVGLSDHSLDEVAAVSAITLGACMIEKHVTLARDDGAIDSKFSLPVGEFKNFVDKLKASQLMLGNVDYACSSPRKNYRSLYAVEDIKEGEVFTENNIRSIRPGYGLEPKYYEEIISKTSASVIKKGTALSWEMINK